MASASFPITAETSPFDNTDRFTAWFINADNNGPVSSVRAELMVIGKFVDSIESIRSLCAVSLMDCTDEGVDISETTKPDKEWLSRPCVLFPQGYEEEIANIRIKGWSIEGPTNFEGSNNQKFQKYVVRGKSKMKQMNLHSDKIRRIFSLTSTENFPMTYIEDVSGFDCDASRTFDLRAYSYFLDGNGHFKSVTQEILSIMSRNNHSSRDVFRALQDTSNDSFGYHSSWNKYSVGFRNYIVRLKSEGLPPVHESWRDHIEYNCIVANHQETNGSNTARRRDGAEGVRYVTKCPWMNWTGTGVQFNVIQCPNNPNLFRRNNTSTNVPVLPLLWGRRNNGGTAVAGAAGSSNRTINAPTNRNNAAIALSGVEENGQVVVSNSNRNEHRVVPVNNSILRNPRVSVTNNNGQDSSSQERRVVTSVDYSQVRVNNETASVGVNTSRQIFRRISRMEDDSTSNQVPPAVHVADGTIDLSNDTSSLERSEEETARKRKNQSDTEETAAKRTLVFGSDETLNCGRLVYLFRDSEDPIDIDRFIAQFDDILKDVETLKQKSLDSLVDLFFIRNGLAASPSEVIRCVLHILLSKQIQWKQDGSLIKWLQRFFTQIIDSKDEGYCTTTFKSFIEMVGALFTSDALTHDTTTEVFHHCLRNVYHSINQKPDNDNEIQGRFPECFDMLLNYVVDRNAKEAAMDLVITIVRSSVRNGMLGGNHLGRVIVCFWTKLDDFAMKWFPVLLDDIHSVIPQEENLVDFLVQLVNMDTGVGSKVLLAESAFRGRVGSIRLVESFCDRAGAISPRHFDSLPGIDLFRHVCSLYEKNSTEFTLNEIGIVLLKIAIISVIDDNTNVDMNIQYLHQLTPQNRDLAKKVKEAFSYFFSAGMFPLRGQHPVRFTEETALIKCLMQQVSGRFVTDRQE